MKIKKKKVITRPIKPKTTCEACKEVVNKKEDLKILSLKLKFNFIK